MAHQLWNGYLENSDSMIFNNRIPGKLLVRDGCYFDHWYSSSACTGLQAAERRDAWNYELNILNNL